MPENQELSALTEQTTPAITDQFYMVDGDGSKRVSASNLRGFMRADTIYVDDYDNVQAAVDKAISLGGAILQFGAGVYDINELVIDTYFPVELRGVGRSLKVNQLTRLEVEPGAVGIQLIGSTGGTPGFVLRDFTLHYGAIPIRWSDDSGNESVGENFRFENLIIRGFSEWGIRFDYGVYFSRFTNVHIKDAAGAVGGWYMSGAGGGLTLLTFESIKLNGLKIGMQIDGVVGQGSTTMINPWFESCGDGGLLMHDMSPITIIGGHFEGNGLNIVDRGDILVTGSAIANMWFMSPVIAGSGRAAEDLPLFLDMPDHVGRRWGLLNVINSGSKWIRVAGTYVMSPVNTQAMTNFIYGDTYYAPGFGPVLIDRVTGVVKRLKVTSGVVGVE